jgi:hypothetical protein
MRKALSINIALLSELSLVLIGKFAAQGTNKQIVLCS